MIRVTNNITRKDIPLYNTELKMQAASERLSTGKKINHAADDVAGFAISISMESQIRGLKQANRNITDGISLIQTADSVLSDVHKMLNRILEITLQASNDIYTSYDRVKMQNEIDQMIEEINNISIRTSFNTKLLFNGTLGYNEEKVFSKTLSTINGIAHKDAEIKGAVWQGNIDLSKIKDGVILKINDTMFEFDSDKNLNTDNSIAINFNPNGTKNELVTAIENTIKNNTLQGKLKDITCNLSLDSILNIKLEASNNDVKNGETFSVLMERVIPKIDVSNSKIDPPLNLGPFGFGAQLTISNIDLNKIVDGTTINVNGNIYEIDSDGFIETGHTAIFITDMKDLDTKANEITKELKKGFSDYIGIFKKGSSWDLIMKYNDYDTEDNQPLNVNFNSDAFNEEKKKVYITDIHSQKGINTPEVKVQQAKRKDIIDFSKVIDGSIFIIDNNKFEFDNDGILSDSSNISVDISSANNTSEIALRFKKAFDLSSIAADYTLSILEVDSDKNIIEISSSEDSTFDGQSISIIYKNVNGLRDDDIGLFLQIGSNKEDKVLLRIDSVSSSYLGISNIDVVSEKIAADNIDSIYNAIDIVSENRSNLGAVYNRLEFIQNNLSISSENLSASRSRILDADIAKEVMNLINVNALQKFSQDILSMTMNFSRDAVCRLLEN